MCFAVKCEDNPHAIAYRITITGSNGGPFTIRVVPRAGVDYEELASKLAEAYTNEGAFKGATEIQGDRSASKVPSAFMLHEVAGLGARTGSSTHLFG